jgi:hypothetical protein
VIDDYLAELRRLLPRRLRQRALDEVEDHLRESAEKYGELEAVRRFGDPAELARGLAAVHVRSAIGAAVVSSAALLVVPLFAYVVTENALPPATWPEGAMPTNLEWKLQAAMGLYGLALSAFAFGALLLLLRRAAAIALLTLGGAAAATAAMGVVATALSLEWADAVVGASRALATLGAAQAIIAAAVAAVAAHARGVVRSAS